MFTQAPCSQEANNYAKHVGIAVFIVILQSVLYYHPQMGHSQNCQPNNNKITLGSLLVTLGIIYGDIGTSPLYVMKAIVGENAVDASVIIGGMSLVFWTLTLQTT